MNHAHHDLDSIAGYANGLDDDSDRIAAQIIGCVLCQHEYEAQVAVKNLLAQVPPAAMTVAEKASLHAAVQIRLSAPQEPAPSKPTLAEPSPIEVARQRRSRRPVPLWTRISAVAAGLLVVVGVGSVWRDLAGVGATATTTTAAALAAEAAPQDFAGGATANPTNAAEAALDQTRRTALIEDMASLKVETERLAETVDPGQGQTDALNRATTTCPEVITGRTVLAVEEATLAGEPIVIYIVATEGGTEAIVVEAANCTVVDLGD